MTLAIVFSRASSGIDAPLVTVEVHLSPGLAGLNIVGLAEAAVKESKDRVRSALLNTHFDFPCRRITINLAPADLPKEGGRFDLPIALGILAASNQLDAKELAQYEFTGELALSGELRAVRGVLPMVLAAHKAGRALIIPVENAKEGGLLKKANVLAASHLLEVCAHLKGEKSLLQCAFQEREVNNTYLDFAEVKGQAHAKRALEIAAAGRHSLLFVGPPGTGKSMLANRLPSILPPISEDQALEVAAIASVSCDGFKPEKWQQIPFRSPHHSSSAVALVGGGRPPRPGEISLAHQGILFLDELPEFARHVLESLREPLESGSITISRAAFQSIFPAAFQLIAAMNPCPCGYAGDGTKICQCAKEHIKRYLRKLSGPLLDRIDMQIEVPRLDAQILASVGAGEASHLVRERVYQAQTRQLARQGKLNSALEAHELDEIAELKPAALALLQQAMEKFQLSARLYHRLIKVALTMKDLENMPIIQERHIAEALNYRYLDRINMNS